MKPQVTENQIREFADVLAEMAQVGAAAPLAEMNFGHPCSWLIQRTEHITFHDLAAEILDAGWRELRLNDAGLKCPVKVEAAGEGAKIVARVGGDQFKDYPVTGPALNTILEEAGYKEKRS
jgi:hypothetical protein